MHNHKGFDSSQPKQEFEATVLTGWSIWTFKDLKTLNFPNLVIKQPTAAHDSCSGLEEWKQMWPSAASRFDQGSSWLIILLRPLSSTWSFHLENSLTRIVFIFVIFPSCVNAVTCCVSTSQEISSLNTETSMWDQKRDAHTFMFEVNIWSSWSVSAGCYALCFYLRCSDAET